MPTTQEICSARVHHRRQELDLTAEEVAYHVGFSIKTLYRFEAGHGTGIHLRYLPKLATVLHVTTDYLLGMDLLPHDEQPRRRRRRRSAASCSMG